MRTTYALCVLAGMLLTGCATDRDRGFLTRTIHDATPDQVLEASGPVLRREFGALIINARGGAIDTRPAAGETATTGTRHVARLRVSPVRGGTLTRLRVDVERQDARRAQVVSATRTEPLGDSPAYTPIERDAATTDRQNQLWTFIRRDRVRERTVLAEIADKFAPPPATVSGGGS